MQLETGKIIAIRTSVKMGHGAQNNHPSATPSTNSRSEHATTFTKSGAQPPLKPTYTSLQESAQSNNIPAISRNHSLIKSSKLNAHPRPLPHLMNRSGLQIANHRQRVVNSVKSKPSDDDVINISNDEDDDEEPISKDVDHQNGAVVTELEKTDLPIPQKPTEVDKADEHHFKEKVVFKPNLVERKPRPALTNTSSASTSHPPPLVRGTQPDSGIFKASPDFPNLDINNKTFGKMSEIPPKLNAPESSFDPSRAPKPMNAGRDDYQFYSQQAQGAQGSYYNYNASNQPRFDNQFDNGYAQSKPSAGFAGRKFLVKYSISDINI